jgi:hypothetical protein
LAVAQTATPANSRKPTLSHTKSAITCKWPLVCTLVIHPFIIGYPFRLRALRRALQHISKFRDEIWVTTPGAVASHFAKINPAP